MRPDRESLLADGRKKQSAGLLDEAERVYERLLAESGDDFEVNHLFGILRQQQGRPIEAVPYLEAALRSRPLSAPTLMGLGLALGALGRQEDAERMLLRSVGLAPAAPEPPANYALCCVRGGRLGEAITWYGRALQAKPDYAPAWTGLGTALQLAGRWREAVVCHNRALDLDPAQSRAHFERAQALQAGHCVEESLADFDAQLRLRPSHHEARSFRLFVLNSRDDLSREQLAAEHAAYGQALECEERPDRRLPGNPDPERRLRVAFVSPDLRAHSVSFFIEPLLAHLDRTRFEVFIYHDHFVCDSVSRRIHAHADRWRKIAGLASSAAEEIIRADAPDIVVDLTGHTGFNRMELFARRLAPVQINYLGYPNTTGLATMDYRLTDPIADPEGVADELHTEKLLRFAPVAWAYAPPPEAPIPARPPSRDGRPVTFGSFNAFSKLNGTTLALWRRVLEAVPGSRLVLKSHGYLASYWREKLAAAGLETDRVELRPAAPDLVAHLASYADVDIALDPLPYNGTTTTCEALWMGVPVITLLGDRHAGRVGATLLTAIGREEWIAGNADDYVAAAVALASDPVRLESLRSGLRGEMSRSLLLDHSGQAARFGAALRGAWRDRCRGPRIESGAGKPARAIFSDSPPDLNCEGNPPVVLEKINQLVALG